MADASPATPCNIIIVGASGDLSRRKLIPALFSLFCNGMLPAGSRIVGFARTPMTDEEFRELIMGNLTCRYTPGENECAANMDAFLQCCVYCAGQYGEPASYLAMQQRLASLGSGEANQLVYMAIPPGVFVPAAQALGEAGLVTAANAERWTRVVLEKPFGHDSQSSGELLQALAAIFDERQTFRIDHYLGKEVIQNLLILRFANLIFEPLWNRNFIDRVDISWSEDFGCEGRAGYFDNSGIIRDVVQNHLLQMLALVGMEQPVRLAPERICEEKVKLLHCVPPLTLEDLVVGQYAAAELKGVAKPGYLDDPEVPKDSVTPTYVRARLRIDNPRWYGVPFVLVAGKALDTRQTEIRIRFREVPYSIFHNFKGLTANELVIRVQPDEAIRLEIINKLPGLELQLEDSSLNLHYQSAFQAIVPDAYERLLLDVLRGDRSLFIRDVELAAAWDIVTPVLHALEQQRVKPLPYAYGGSGPEIND